MSVNESSESTDAVFQTPSSVVEELELVERQEEELGASPELSGPTTRSGRKRKNVVPVRSAGKKKNKMNTVRSPPNAAAPKAAGTGRTPRQNQSQSETPQPQRAPPQDLAALLTSGLSTLQNSMNGMESRLTEKMVGLEAAVNSNKNSISQLTNTLSKNTVDLARLESRIREGEENFEGRVTDIGEDSRNLPIGRHEAESGRRLTPAQIDRYDRCRRSLRIWPIDGPDLTAAVRSFLVDKLGFDEEMVDRDFGSLEARRIVEPRSKIQKEVVVEFPSAAIRDSIKSSGYRLEGQGAGLRIEVPNFLKSDFHVLQNLAYKMKLVNKEVKRSVKFEDDTYGLMLDIQLPGQEWRRVRPEQARQARRADPLVHSGPLDMTQDMIAGAVRGDSMSSDWSGPSNSSGSSSAASGSNSVPLGRKE